MEEKKGWKVLFFDIDGTLLDFDAGAAEAMEIALGSFGLPYGPDYLPIFYRENDKLWERIERQELTREDLRKVRWQTVLPLLGLPADHAEEIEDRFRSELHHSGVLIPGAVDCLAALTGKVRLCGASNGPQEQQEARLRKAGLLDYFEHCFTSGGVGVNKPDGRFFDACFAQLPGVRPEECLMVGDSLTADMAGAAAYGMATCWYAPGGEQPPVEPRVDYVIRSLTQVPELVLG